MNDYTYNNIETSKKPSPKKKLPESIKARRRQIKVEAMKMLRSKQFFNPNFSKKILITGSGIDEWLNQPHKQYAEKNEALLSLERLLGTSNYLGYVEDPRNRKDILKCHLFEVTICGESSWIIIHEMTWGECLVHSISDTNLMNKLKSP